MSSGRWLLFGGGVVVVATLAMAIAVTGTPSQQRAAKLDARRVADLVLIEQQIERHRRLEQQLPQDLAALLAAADQQFDIADPETGAAYGYAVTGEREYQLCATFLTDSADIRRRAEPWMDARWTHPAGEHCFRRKLEPADRG